ncbi:hypothetical protein [Phaeobacter porticola]|uniref:Uncharacterized protein n=1 Tax=Phaeobacter porticola TaxID=1844006 RepID=A0A1L3I0G0_9RHOB|nr:hypothetical protein [Phaeobacter porticola]APG45613.1 hypothetical protein PhaeoP97_00158 [Phaeobacter porticola]
MSDIDDEGKNLKSALTDPIRKDPIADNLIQRRFIADSSSYQANTVSNLPTINANRRQLVRFTIRYSVTSRAVGLEYRRPDWQIGDRESLQNCRA